MNIVVMTGAYYPQYSANGKCLGNIIEEIEYDHQITVICNDPSDRKKKEIYRNHEIVRVNTIRQKRRKNLEDKILQTDGINKLLRQVLLIIYKASFVIKIIFSRYTVDYELVEEYLKALTAIEYTVDVIIPSCNPIESILAAQKYKAMSRRKLIIVPFLFDKFSTSTIRHRFEFNRAIKMKGHLRLEEDFIEQSHKVLTYFSWADHIKKYFPQFEEKIVYVEHPLVKKPDSIQANKKNISEEISVVYAGGLSRKIRPPQYAIELLKGMIDENPAIMVHLYITGDCNTIVNEKIKQYSAHIKNHGSVTSSEAVNAMSAATHLLLIGNTDITQLQSKAYEYMSCGKPIILLFNHINDPLIRILSEYPYVCMLEQNEKQYENNKRKLLDFLHISRDVYVEYSDVARIYYDSTPEYVANRILKIIDSNAMEK